MDIEPTCPDEYLFSKTNCRCTKTLKNTNTSKTTKTRKHQLNTKEQILDDLSIPPGKKRCPNGYRKNKQNGRCTRKKNTKQTKHAKQTKHSNQTSNKKNIHTIKNTSPLGEQKISVAINKLIVENKINTTGEKTFVSSIVPLISKQVMRQKSFSPQINKQLASMRTPNGLSNIFGCGIEHVMTDGDSHKINALKIMIGRNKSGIPICATRKHKKAVQLLLNNLRSNKNLDCSKVVGPVQSQSNCWFNTMFMTFFVSDKGRKFFRFFRQLMIEGKQANGITIKPPALAEALFLLNACVEACHNVTDSSNVKELALAMDTNNVILRIYKAIPKRRYHAIKNVGEANNPMGYYTAIIDFLGNNSIYIHTLHPKSYFELENIGNGHTIAKQTPDVVSLNIKEESKDDYLMMTNKPLSFKINSHTYVLDSAIIRDTKKKHFCSLLTCNGKQMGYDGTSLSRMQDFDWKGKINKDISWTFDGSVWNRTNKNIMWNFCREYVILFYYRVD